MEEKVIMVDIEKIKPNPKNFFRPLDPEEMVDFISSLKDVGMIQPIIVDKDSTIIAGEQRWRAAKEMGWKEVPVIIRDEPDEKKREIIMIHENIRRRHLTPGEMMKAVSRLVELTGSTYKAAKESGIPKRTVIRYAQIDRSLIQELKELLNNSKLGPHAAEIISRLTEDEQRNFYEELKSLGNPILEQEIAKKYGKEISHYRMQIHELEEKEKALTEKIEDMERALRAEYEENTKLNDMVNRVLTERDDAREDLDDLREELQMIRAERNQLKEQKNVMKLRVSRRLSDLDLAFAHQAVLKYIEPLNLLKVPPEKYQELFKIFMIVFRKCAKNLDVSKIPQAMLIDWVDELWLWIKSVRNNLGVKDAKEDIKNKN